MPELETLLRDVRPEPDPQWAARLDARAAAGFPSPPSRFRRALAAVRAHFAAFGAVGAVASLLILFVVAVPKGTDDSETTSGAGSAELVAPQTATEDAAGGVAPSAPERRATTPGGDRAVLRNATIELSTRPGEVERVTDRAIRIVDTLGGYVESSEVDRSGNRARATLTLKIPTVDLDKGIAQISALAHVSSRSQQAQDVTDERERLEALVRDARADREGLRARLAKATTDRERSRLRAALDRATRRVTARTRDLNQLGREVSYGTVEVSVVGARGTGAAGGDDRWTPGDALGDAVRVLEVIAAVLVIALAIALPAALLIALALLAGRGLRQRRRERALGSV